MKDYSLNEEEKITFILNYKVKKNRIIVNLASGNSHEVEYTIENEKIILEKMRRQLLLANSETLKKDFNYHLGWFAFASGNLGLDMYQILVSDHKALYAVLSSWFALQSCYHACSMLVEKWRLNDYKKNKLFLDNEDLFLEEVKDDDDFIIEEYALTLNDVDKMSYKQLMNAIEAAKFDNCLEETSKKLERRK